MSKCLENTCIGSGVCCTGCMAVPFIILAAPEIIVAVAIVLPFVIVGGIVGGIGVGSYYAVKGIAKGTKHCFNSIEETLDERKERREAESASGLETHKKSRFGGSFFKHSKKDKSESVEDTQNELVITRINQA